MNVVECLKRTAVKGSGVETSLMGEMRNIFAVLFYFFFAFPTSDLEKSGV